MTLAFALTALAGPALAQDPAPPPRSSVDDGVWMVVGLTTPTPAGDLAFYGGRLGGLDSRFVQTEFGVPAGGGVNLIGGYALVDSRGDLAQLLRLGASGSRRAGRLELDGRGLAERLVREAGEDASRARLRLRGTLALTGGERPVLRAFVADEIFLEEGRGVGRDRLTAGVRTRPRPRLDLDIYWLRETVREGPGADYDAAVIQLTAHAGDRR